MILKFNKSQSNSYPELLDTTSSKKVVYIRQNVIELEKVDEETGKTFIFYEYEEAKLTKDEYKVYLDELNANHTLESIENLKAENEMLKEQIMMLDETMVVMLEEILPSLMDE